MTQRPEYLPDRLASLRDVAAAKFLTAGVLHGRENPPAIAVGKVAEPLEAELDRTAATAVRDLVDDVMHLHDRADRTSADAWLAPRLHATLRLNRAEAADGGRWTFLALAVAPDYVVWRHLPLSPSSQGEPAKVAGARFLGPLYTQAFARLWWAAELFRDGPDYRPAVTACGNQDMLNTVLRLDVIDHRPTAQAVVRLVEAGLVSRGRAVNALATAVNAAAGTVFYEALAPDTEPDPSAAEQWRAERADAPPVPRRALPEGPDEPSTPVEAIDLLDRHFRELFAQAPVRGKDMADRAAGTRADTAALF
ncbi:DUF6339 family protein [Streptomyces sp. NPDC002248]